MNTDEGRDPTSKILTRAALLRAVENLRASRKRIVFTNGCFDVLHIGHVNALQLAAKLGDILIVAVNSDESVKHCKGPSRPIVGQEDRLAMLAALSCVDYVTLFEEDTPTELIRLIRPEILAKSIQELKTTVVGAELVTAANGCILLTPQRTSTTELERRIRELAP